MQDYELIELYFSRDETAIKQTSLTYGSALSRIASGILKDRRDAEEVMNDAYLAAWNSIPPERPESLFAYISKIVRNTALVRLRDDSAAKRGKNATVCLDELSEVLSSDDDVSAHVEAEELSRIINGFLRQQDADERDVFILRYYGYMQVKDIADKYGFTQSRVKMMLKRTRDKLASVLERNGYKI